MYKDLKCEDAQRLQYENGSTRESDSSTKMTLNSFNSTYK